MDRETRRKVTGVRRAQGEIESNLVDELIAGEISRQDFLRRGVMFGMAVPTVALLADAIAGPAAAVASPRAVKAGGTLRVGNLTPAVAIDPVTSNTQAVLAATSITGEYLLYTNPKNSQLVPVLATSWTHDATGRTWSFKIREGVKFHDGTTLDAGDVSATFERLVSPASASAGASAFKGYLSPNHTEVQGNTCIFHLDAPNANFPYLVSSTTYQAVILPKSYQIGTYEESFIGTGPYKLAPGGYTQGVGISFVRNTDYWGGTPPLDGVHMGFYQDSASQILALQGGQLDLIPQFGFQEGRALFTNHNIQVFSVRSSAHRQIPMRMDLAPTSDVNVRKAIALSLNRPDVIKKLFAGRADLGNDCPIAPVQVAFNKSVPQRHQDISQAKSLLSKSKYKNISLTITTYKAYELPDLAALVQEAAKAIGVKFSIKVLTAAQYYGGKQILSKTTSGGTPWENAQVTITDWAPRAVPNVLLTSAVKGGGVWNVARYNNKQVNTWVNQLVAALDTKTQQSIAGKIEQQMLNDTPLILPYYYNYLAAGTLHVHGYVADAVGLINLKGVSLA
jgi:peptide/nickel transport system substrate-binding protein